MNNSKHIHKESKETNDRTPTSKRETNIQKDKNKIINNNIGIPVNIESIIINLSQSQEFEKKGNEEKVDKNE